MGDQVFDVGNDPAALIERGELLADIVCVGFGPAVGGFLTTLSRQLTSEDGTPRFQSRTTPGMPLQVLCFERADDPGAGVSGVVTRARGIRESFPELVRLPSTALGPGTPSLDGARDGPELVEGPDTTTGSAPFPLVARVTGERVLYLLDPIGASRRSRPLRIIDSLAGVLAKDHAVALPITPGFLAKRGGLVMSIGQFNQWVASQVLATGQIQIWPSTPAASALIGNDGTRRVDGVRLIDQGTGKNGEPSATFVAGMDVRAALTVVGDGPVGAIGRQLDDEFGMPDGRKRDEWALGMKMVVDLPTDRPMTPGTVLHTFGFPEPEIFGFLYALSEHTVSLGIFVPSTFHSPARTAYRYLQHWMMHPAIWRHIDGGTLRSWGAKSILESGRRAEPWLTGDGYARVGECSGSTNPLTASGVDEAWTTGVQLAESVVELLKGGEDFTAANLDRTYVAKRRASWVDRELQAATNARTGFERGLLWGLTSMALAGFTGGRIGLPASKPRRVGSVEEFFGDRIAPEEIARIRSACQAEGTSLHDALMDRSGWPAIAHDGRLLVTHQDGLLMGGKVQAPGGYADHVTFAAPALCVECRTKLCVEMCSGEAITAPPEGGVRFDREKCVHCGACLWNCAEANLHLTAGTGGLHSVEN